MRSTRSRTSFLAGSYANNNAVKKAMNSPGVLPTWIVFELMPTKLPHYVLPTYPALALIAGWGFAELAKTANWARWAGWGLFGLAALVFAIFVPAIFMTFGDGTSRDVLALVQASFDGTAEPGLSPAMTALVLAAAAVFAGVAGAPLIAGWLRAGSEDPDGRNDEQPRASVGLSKTQHSFVLRWRTQASPRLCPPSWPGARPQRARAPGWAAPASGQGEHPEHPLALALALPLLVSPGHLVERLNWLDL